MSKLNLFSFFGFIGTGGEFEGSGYNSNFFPDNTMTDEPEEAGGIFAKCLGWLGCCFGAPSPNSYYESSTMCPAELEKTRGHQNINLSYSR